MRKEPLRNTAKRSSLIDIKAARASTDLVPARMGSAMSPGAELHGRGNVALLPNGMSLLGSRSVLWGTNSVFGGSVLWGTNISGQSSVWSTYTLAQPNILWGKNAVSTAGVLWGSSVLWGTISMGQDSTAPGRSFLTLRSPSTRRSSYVS